MHIFKGELQDKRDSKEIMNLPVTRYYGSKRRVVEAIWNALIKEHVEFDSFLDLFGGTGIVSYYMEAKGKSVIYNDIFRFNCVDAEALLATPKGMMSEDEAMNLLKRNPNFHYKDVIERNFKGIYYPEEENRMIDTIVQNVQLLDNDKQPCGYYLLNQTCLIKRPFNIFHRKNLNLRLNHEKSKFGNYVTWEKGFDFFFKRFINELNTYQFEQPHNIEIINQNALECNRTADVVYIDTPYFDEHTPISYHARYHFLEGLQYYDEIELNINNNKANKEIEINTNNDFENKNTYIEHLNLLFDKYRDKTVLLSYTSKGYPTIDELIHIVKEHKDNVHAVSLGRHSFALNRGNKDREEILIIGV